MIATAIIIGILLLILIIRRYNLSIQFSKEVKNLFAISTSISGNKFSYARLTGLPAPVQRYFKLVLKDGQPYISYIRLLHNGQFKTGLDKDWVSIKGEQYFTTEKPGFIWKGTTSMFTACDRYIAGKGRLVVSLFSLYNIVDGRGETFDQGELLRWLAEGVWFPTNLLPGEKLHWTSINENTAKLTFNYNGLSLFYIVTFSNTGEIVQLETKRYMDKERMETWIGKLNDYKEINGVLIPTAIEAVWRLEKGDFSYAKFRVTSITYDRPEMFS